MTSAPALAELPIENSLERTIKEIGIPPRPAILERIAEEMKQDAPNFKHLGKLISADVSLAAGLIKTANSAYFGAVARVRSVDEALFRLGLDVTSRALAGICLRKAFPASMTLDRFWHASAQIAALSGWLDQEVIETRNKVGDAYTYGLFRDCGIPVLLQRFPHYRQTLARANDNALRSFVAVEEEEFPTNHAMIGCLLAQSWWLPEEICLAIRHHHDLLSIEFPTSSIPLASRQLIALGQLAEHVLNKLTGGSRTCEWEKLGAACLQVLDLTEEALPAIYDGAAEVVAGVE